MSQSSSEPAAMDPGAASPAGRQARVHDLGYKRYEGVRRPQSMRYRTILLQVVASSWRGFWHMKAWVITAVLTTFTMGTIMYLSEGLSSLMRGGQKLAIAEALLPMSFQFYALSVLPLSFMVLAVMVANDLRTGAFEFYFARPVRTRDYVLGKLGGAALIVGALTFAGPLLLSLFRLGLVGADRFAATLPLVTRTAVIGVVATLVHATVPVAFSAISSRKRYTLAAWAIFYFVVGKIAPVIGHEAGIEELGLLDISHAVTAFAYEIYDVAPLTGPTLPSGWTALAALAGYVAVSVAVVYWRVARAERAGMGGG